MKLKVGPPVEGKDFIGREKELAFAWNLLEDGNNLLLAAPRRVGKTSFAKKLIEEAKSKKWRTLELNIEGLKTEQAFIIAFIDELKKSSWWSNLSKNITSNLEKLLDNIDLSIEYNDVKTNIGWNSKKEKIFKELENLFDHTTETLIFIDELGVFLNKYEKQKNIQDAAYLLNWFRSIRQISKTKIRWVFCSSVSINNFTSRHNISYTINDVESFEIKAFNEPTAKILISELAKSKDIIISDNVMDAMLTNLEWYLPYFIQLLFKEIYSLHFLKEEPINETIVLMAFENLASKDYLDTWDERLEFYNTKENNTRKILNHLAQNNILSVTRRQLFNIIHTIDTSKEDTTDLLGDLLRMLMNDGYLIQDENDKFRFRSPLLKKYWYNKFLR